MNKEENRGTCLNTESKLDFFMLSIYLYSCSNLDGTEEWGIMFFCLLDYCCNTIASLLQINGSAVFTCFY